MDAAILRPIAPPDNESKLALRAHAHALVPAKSHHIDMSENKMQFIMIVFAYSGIFMEILFVRKVPLFVRSLYPHQWEHTMHKSEP